MRVDVARLVEVEAEEQLEVGLRVGVVEELRHGARQPARARLADVQREGVEARRHRLLDVLLRVVRVGIYPADLYMG